MVRRMHILQDHQQLREGITPVRMITHIKGILMAVLDGLIYPMIHRPVLTRMKLMVPVKYIIEKAD